VSESARRTLGVVGAGNMGSGIAQKMAAEGFRVVLVDLDEEKAARGLRTVEHTLADGVERGLFTRERAADVARRIQATARFEELAAAELVVEAVFEDLAVKRRVFAELDRVCRPEAILGTNTSSFSVADVGAGTRRPERVIGLHYFYHPAKNRLVEVAPGARTAPGVFRRAWTLQEALGKTPIRSRDSCGFVVNRFFSPWLNEAVRLLEEGVADAATVDAAAKQAFEIGMGPFELMNVTGIPIALHTADTLGRAFGPLYAAPARLRERFESGGTWDLTGTPDATRFAAVADRLAAVVFHVAGALVDEGVGTIDDTDIGARVGLRWRRGPFELMNHYGAERASTLVHEVARRWQVAVPETIASHTRRGEPFRFTLVQTEVADGIATLTINRPDAMNALDEAVVEQLATAFRAAAAEASVQGIVLAGSGKAFIAGADIRFFLRNMESKDLGRIVEFTKKAQDLLLDIERCPKPVVARVRGLALGGGVEVALACHFIVATPNASFAFPETGIGIYPGLGGTQRTTRRVGTGLAKWLVLSGQTVGAEEALAIGLVDRVAPLERLDEAVGECLAGPPRTQAPRAVPESHRELADFFARLDTRHLPSAAPADPRVASALKRVRMRAPIALRLAAELIERGAAMALEEGLALELAHLEEIFATADAYEGLSSLGGRPAVFKGV
jgi:enoyl-CoA hydratase/3-hydroxyacyl-CoA dehydrogenase